MTSCAISAWPYDFSAVAPTGQTLYYSIINNTSNVAVVGPSYYYGYDGYTKPTGSLIIPLSVLYNGNTYSVTTIEESAFLECFGLTTVTIQNSIDTIKGGAFCMCTGLSIVNFNADSCVVLPGVYINNGVIGTTETVFFGCSNITTFNIGDNVKIIPKYLCNGLAQLASITIPDSITSIGRSAFYGCIGLTAVTIPNSVTSIGEYAFSHCSGLTSLTIPNSVTSIGSMAFRGCTGITEITSQPTVAPLLGTNAFDGVNTAIPINIPCGSSMSYYSRWSYFSNFVEDPAFQFEVASADETMGSVSVLTQPTCSAPTAVFNAIPNSGYRFDHWSDGNTENPRSLTVTSDTNIAAYFAAATSDTVYIYVHDTVYIHDTIYITSEGIGDVEAISAKIYQRDGQIVVEGANSNTVVFYDVNGRMLATKRDEYAPLRFDAPVSGTYMIKIGNHPARKVVVVR